MHVHCKMLLAVALLITAFAAAAPADAHSDLLDGKVFVAEAGEKGRAADAKGDVITFRAGTFHSSRCDQWGYGKGIYHAVALADVIQFETEIKSEQEGRLTWNGVIRGDTIEGLFTHYRKPRWYNKNPAPVEHWFKGKLKPS